MKSVEDYKINLGVLVICEILELLKDNYFGCLQDDVENELEKFNDILLKYLNINDPKYKKYDMDKVEYIMRYYYIPISKKKKGHNK